MAVSPSGADTGVVNGAMLFDAARIEPLFQLETGLPGNSFAFELARKMGLPEDIVHDAETRAGEEYVGIERNLRKIVRRRKALDEKLQKALRFIRKAGRKGIARAVLLKKAHLSSREIDEVESTLLDRDEITVSVLPRSTNGKVAKLYIAIK